MKFSNYNLIRKSVHFSIVFGLAMSLSLGLVQQGFAQQGPVGDLPGFLANGPKVGERLPDVSIFNDMGEPVSIRDLTKGSYSVMVLGCLT